MAFPPFQPKPWRVLRKMMECVKQGRLAPRSVSTYHSMRTHLHRQQVRRRTTLIGMQDFYSAAQMLGLRTGCPTIGVLPGRLEHSKH
jgi:hypothetical protein